MQRGALLQRLWPHATIGGVLLAMFGGLAVRGFNFGLYADVLVYIYRYQVHGTRGGMNWLVVDHWHRHLAGALVSAPLHVLFPPDDAPWFALAFFLHFLNAFVFFCFLYDWLRGKHKLLIFSAALIFAFDTLDIIYQYIYGTSSHQKFALTLAILSLWCYMRFVRNGRQQLMLYNASWFLFALGGSIYEQSLFFFMLHPFLAIVEEWQQPIAQPRRPYLIRLFNDMIPYGLFVLAYAYLLDVLFLSSRSNITVGHIVTQFVESFRIALFPVDIIGRMSFAWQGAWILLTAAVGLIAGVALWQWRKRTFTEQAPLMMIALFGFGISFLNVANIAPTDFNVNFDSRLIYAMSLGNSLLVIAAVDWVTRRIPNTRVHLAVFSIVLGVWIGSGVSYFFRQQHVFLTQDTVREQVRTAVHEALPMWDEETPPYLLILTDKHPQDDLFLFAQNNDFPFIFDLMYDTEGILADAVFYDIEKPPETSEQHIIATEDGIISPLRPDQRIDPDRLVVIAYDSETDTANVLDAMPEDALAGSNLHTEVPFDWETNRDYLN
ncbi:MAG: hypothetical protein AAFU54_03040 [Chloroflexota bacterium]